MSLALCVAIFLAALLLTLRSKVAGLVVVTASGYMYGIFRANYPDALSFFTFDAAVVGFYASFAALWWPRRQLGYDQEVLKRWVFHMLGWVMVMFLIPFQHPYIQLVGMRGNGFLLPFVLVGCWLEGRDIRNLALWLSVLNMGAFTFALAEYVMGVPAFYPRNAVTELIYRSGDLMNFTAYRIPACFANSASYGGTMVATLPFLLGAYVQKGSSGKQRLLLLAGMAVALIGVFMCASRVAFLTVAIMIALTTFSGKVKGGLFIGWLVLLGGIAYLVMTQERMQRFVSLSETEAVTGRLETSVNMGFVDLLVNYPLGNGMGAGGTSIPFFLMNLVQRPILVENEYARILLEQGLGGLALWVAFVFWCATRRPRAKGDAWLFGKQMSWFFAMLTFAFAALGTGMMTSIPQSMLFLLGLGFVFAPPQAVRRKPGPTAVRVPEETRIQAKRDAQAKAIAPVPV